GRPSTCLGVTTTPTPPTEPVLTLYCEQCRRRCPGACDDEAYDLHDIGRVFKLSIKGARALTKSPGFPDTIVVSARCYRWAKPEVLAYRDSLRVAPHDGSAA